MGFTTPLIIVNCLFVIVFCATIQSEIKSVAKPSADLPSDVETIELRMKDAVPSKDDSYICSSYDMPADQVYIVKYEAIANASTAHHILLFGCSDGPAVNSPHWGCPPLCNGREQIMFAWAKNAPPTVLPKGVGFRVGGGSTIKNIVLQIHYAKASNAPDRSGIRIYITRQEQKYVAGIFLMMSYSITIPPHKPVVHSDISCKYDGQTVMYPFAYRTHAHDLGRVITGYQYTDDEYKLMGKGNPQWPQAFYPVDTKEQIVVKPGDIMLARCTFNSTSRDTTTYVGATGKDEMCNFYTMFYTDSSVQTTFSQCGGSRYPELVRNLPFDSDKPLPPNPLLDEKAGHHHVHHPTHQQQPQPQPQPTPPPTPTPGEKQNSDVIFDGEWSTGNITLGQVSGVATDSDGNVYVFHRGSTTWKWNSFDVNNRLTNTNNVIKEKTILVYNKEGVLIRSFGENMFYMPHGLAVDQNKNVWVTDVGSHQVLRFPAGKNEPDLTLGEKFIPDSDDNHFCKPTDVAVLSNGQFFISDGYCNGRIMKYSSNGTLLTKFGKQDIVASGADGPPIGAFDIPHSITVAEDKGLVCVADRENGRIQCFDLEGGFSHQMNNKEFGSRLFALEYSPLHGGLLFAVNGPAIDGNRVPVQGFTMNIKTGELLQSWNKPQGLSNPHDIAVNPVDHSVYVGELDNSLLKFNMSHTESLIATPDKKDNIPVQGDDKDTSDKDKSVNKPVKAKKSVTPSIIIGVLLVVPVVLVIVITVLVRMYQTGKFGKKKGNKVFNIQNFFNSHRGFDKLSTEESDHEFDGLDDSDQEEYTAPVKHKQRT